MLSRKYEQADTWQLAQLDQALELVGGNFVAAAKLIDLEPVRVKNLIHYHARLRARWGRKRRGRPPGPVRLRIRPYHDPMKDIARQGVEFAKLFIRKKLGVVERRELAEWMAARNKEEFPVSDRQGMAQQAKNQDPFTAAKHR